MAGAGWQHQMLWGPGAGHEATEVRCAQPVTPSSSWMSDGPNFCSISAVSNTCPHVLGLGPLNPDSCAQLLR